MKNSKKDDITLFLTCIKKIVDFILKILVNIYEKYLNDKFKNLFKKIGIILFIIIAFICLLFLLLLNYVLIFIIYLYKKIINQIKKILRKKKKNES